MTDHLFDPAIARDLLHAASVHEGRFWIDVDDSVAFWRAENAFLARFQQQPEDVPG